MYTLWTAGFYLVHATYADDLRGERDGKPNLLLKCRECIICLA